MRSILIFQILTSRPSILSGSGELSLELAEDEDSSLEDSDDELSSSSLTAGTGAVGGMMALTRGIRTPGLGRSCVLSRLIVRLSIEE